MRNFIRGMGAGILAATLVLAVAYMLEGSNISDDEIRSRAKKLGMTEQEAPVVVKKDEQGENQEPAAEQPAEEPVQDPLQQPEPEPAAEEPVQETVQRPEPEPETESPAPTSTPTAQPSQGTVTVEIKTGMDGVTICYLLQEKGVVDDAMALNRYLSSNKLQTKLRPGVYELRPGMSYEEAASKIVYK